MEINTILVIFKHQDPNLTLKAHVQTLCNPSYHAQERDHYLHQKIPLQLLIFKQITCLDLFIVVHVHVHKLIA